MTDHNSVLAAIRPIISSYFEAHSIDNTFRPGLDPVRVAQPIFAAEEILAVIDALLEGWLGANWRAEQMEKLLADYVGVPRVALTNSGSSANLLALEVLADYRHCSPGDEIITPALTFPTTVKAILNKGLVPVLVDSTPGSYTMNVEDLDKALSAKTKGIFVVHVLGNPVDMRSVNSFAEKHGLFVIEDACDALGATIGDKMVGGFGDFGTFSFYASHHMTMGEGGAVAIRDHELSERIITMREWGRNNSSFGSGPQQNKSWRERFVPEDPILDRYDKKYTYTMQGYNFKVTEFQAAMGLAQYASLPEFINQRQINFDRLLHALSPLESFFVLPFSGPTATAAWLFFPLTVRNNAPFTRIELVEWLEARNIETRPVLAGNISKQPAYRGMPHRQVGDLRYTDEIMKQSVCIGLHPGLGARELDFVCEQIVSFTHSKSSA